MLGIGTLKEVPLPPAYGFDPDIRRLAVTTPAYSTAITPVSDVGNGGAELSRLIDSTGVPLSGSGGNGVTSSGFGLRLAAGDRTILETQPGSRWPQGFVCPRCGHAGGWTLGDGRYKCTSCEARTSVTAGTLFDRRRTPLSVWFTACWMFASQKDGVSALRLQRALEIGSYATAWAMLHRLRCVLVRPGRERLHGTVEVDETYIGSEEPGLRGGRAKGKKTLDRDRGRAAPATRLRTLPPGGHR